MRPRPASSAEGEDDAVTPPRPAAHATPAARGEAQRHANVRLALVLASVAVAFAVGFVVKIALLGGA